QILFKSDGIETLALLDKAFCTKIVHAFSIKNHSAKRSKKILYYTESMLREWVDRAKCVSVPAGANLELFHENDEKRREIRSTLDFDQRSFVLGYVGTFQKWHGIDTLLKAVRTIKDKAPDLRLLLIGPNFEAYRSLSEELGVSEMTNFLGPMEYETVPDYTNACDVMLALYEPKKDPVRERYGIGWPIKILEYMACGKPTISTKVDPVTKIITSPELGFLVAPGNEKELSDIIISLYNERKELQWIGMKGKELVMENYSWAKVAQIISGLM
ncbi:MAG: glycosyltransferase family 4 protein, partial [Thaumarchaeota archaeon]|nr:glycosyltransferase family 4 protein [Nitrososphaerota archaeon]